MAAVARCRRCGSALCDTCFRLLADGAPVCEICALELSAGPPSRWPFAIAFLGISIALCSGIARLEMPDPSWVLWGITLAVAFVVAIVIGVSSPSREPERRSEISERDLELEPSPELLRGAAHPYRTRIGRVARRVVPLSGRSTALIMAAAFVVSGVTLPLGLKLPGWVELELVLASWWLAIFALLTVLLYKRLRLAQDYRFTASPAPASPAGDKKGWEEVGAGCSNAAGCAEGLVIVAVLAVALAAAWALVELVLPVLFFLFYYFVVKAIGRVAEDRHDCEGRLGRSLAWGAAWATLYVAPVALVTWLVHAVLAVHV